MVLRHPPDGVNESEYYSEPYWDLRDVLDFEQVSCRECLEAVEKYLDRLYYSEFDPIGLIEYGIKMAEYTQVAVGTSLWNATCGKSSFAKQKVKRALELLLYPNPIINYPTRPVEAISVYGCREGSIKPVQLLPQESDSPLVRHMAYQFAHSMLALVKNPNFNITSITEVFVKRYFDEFKGGRSSGVNSRSSHHDDRSGVTLDDISGALRLMLLGEVRRYFDDLSTLLKEYYCSENDSDFWPRHSGKSDKFCEAVGIITKLTKFVMCTELAALDMRYSSSDSNE